MNCFYIKEPEGIERLKFTKTHAIFNQDGLTIEMSKARFKQKYGFFCEMNCNDCELRRNH